jgi:hypothetical protein
MCSIFSVPGFSASGLAGRLARLVGTYFSTPLGFSTLVCSPGYTGTWTP